MYSLNADKQETPGKLFENRNHITRYTSTRIQDLHNLHTEVSCLKCYLYLIVQVLIVQLQYNCIIIFENYIVKTFHIKITQVLKHMGLNKCLREELPSDNQPNKQKKSLHCTFGLNNVHLALIISINNGDIKLVNY